VSVDRSQLLSSALQKRMLTQ